MDKPIEVGKWAVIDKPYRCCGYKSKGFGIPFIVLALKQHRSGGCPNCKAIDYAADACVGVGTGRTPTSMAPLYVCKRIDDPGEEQSTEEREENREPTPAL